VTFQKLPDGTIKLSATSESNPSSAVSKFCEVVEDDAALSVWSYKTTAGVHEGDGSEVAVAVAVGVSNPVGVGDGVPVDVGVGVGVSIPGVPVDVAVGDMPVDVGVGPAVPVDVGVGETQDTSV